MESVEQMKVGNLVKLPAGRFWWNGKIGIVSETRIGNFIDCMGKGLQKQECKIEFGEDFIWYWDAEKMELLNAVS